jgi:hypothetical protein
LLIEHFRQIDAHEQGAGAERHPRLIEPFPLLVLIVTCLVGDQQPFAFLTKASHGNDAWGCDISADAAAVQEVQTINQYKSI